MKKQMILWTCMLLLVLAGCKKDDVCSIQTGMN